MAFQINKTNSDQGNKQINNNKAGRRLDLRT